MPGAHKIGAAISGPRIAGGNFMDITLFLSVPRGGVWGRVQGGGGGGFPLENEGKAEGA